MKTIGTCKECKEWDDANKLCHVFATCGFFPSADFGCIHWEDKRGNREWMDWDGDFPAIGSKLSNGSIVIETAEELDTTAQTYDLKTRKRIQVVAHLIISPPREKYPTRTAEELLITDLKRENSAAFEQIEKLSKALADNGIDPTQLP